MSEIARGIITAIDDTKTCQTLQTELLADEVIDNVEHVQPFGVSFKPPADAECIVAALGDDRGNSVAFGVTSRADRPKNLDDPGTGGLYYQGTFRVFIDSAGVVHLGEQVATDFVALASLVKAELEAIKTTFASYVPGTAGGSFGTPYVPGDVAATKTKAT